MGFIPFVPTAGNITLPLPVADGGTGLNASPITIALGGTNAITQQAAIDSLAGAVTSGKILRGNGTHVLLDQMLAADQGSSAGSFFATGMLGQPNSNRAAYTAVTNALATSGTVYLVSYYLPANTTITAISFETGTTTLKTGGTHGWYVLCDQNRVVRAVSADQTDDHTTWGVASTVYTLNVTTDGSTKFVTTYGGLYYLGIMVANTSGTQPNLIATATAGTGVAGSTIGPSMCGASTTTGQTTPPAGDGSVTIGTVSGDAARNWICWVT
jgi:hypothetical protein